MRKAGFQAKKRLRSSKELSFKEHFFRDYSQVWILSNFWHFRGNLSVNKSSVCGDEVKVQ